MIGFSEEEPVKRGAKLVIDMPIIKKELTDVDFVVQEIKLAKDWDKSISKELKLDKTKKPLW